MTRDAAEVKFRDPLAVIPASKSKAIFFDLDGTLIDSLPGISFAFRGAMARVCPHVAVPDLRTWIGPTVREIFARMVAGSTAETQERFEREFRDLYDSDGWLQTGMYPGADRFLHTLNDNGVMCFVVTNKPFAAAKRILDFLGLSPLFNEIVSRDSRTPPYLLKSEVLAGLLERHRLGPAECLFLGDTRDDQISAEQCQVPFVALAHGYGQGWDSSVLVVNGFEDLAYHVH